MQTGINLIAKERQEQITKHGRTIADDVQYNLHNELLRAAVVIIDPEHNDASSWPWQDNTAVYFHIINKPHIERMAIAGAFIAAAIDRELYLSNGEKNDERSVATQAQ